MNFKFLAMIAGLVLTLAFVFQTGEAQTPAKVPAKEASVIAYLVKESNLPDSNPANNPFLSVTIGKTAYIAELKSGRVISQSRVNEGSGGFSGVYAEVWINLLDTNKQEAGQGAGRILKLTAGKWKTVAINETDYQCADVKTIPKATLKALKVECN